MDSVGYPFVFRVEVSGLNSFPDLKKCIISHFENDCDIVPHQSDSRSYLVRHRNQNVANSLLCEQFLWTEAGDKLTFYDDGEDSQEEDILKDTGFSDGGGETNVQNNESNQLKISVESGIQASVKPKFDNKKKLDDLKSYEKVILFKTKFVDRLANSELTAKHKSSDKTPVLSGPSQFIKEAEFKVMKFLRQIIMDKEINLLSEVTDESKREKMCNKIIVKLDERFYNDPIAFENHNGQIIIYSTDAEKLKEAKNYLQNNLHQEFIPINDRTKFRYMETNLKIEFDKLNDASDFVSIFSRKPDTGNRLPGYVVLVYGNKKDFDDLKIKLMKTIESIIQSEMELTVQKLSDNIEIMLGGIEKKWNVMVNVSNPETARVAPVDGAFIKGITVAFVEGKIEDQKVDVLVNSTGSDLKLEAGPVAKSISNKAGYELQRECNTKAPLSVGQVVETKAYNLPCKSVFHCLAEKWYEGNAEKSQDVLMKVVTTCLQMANDKGLTSIAFPPIACGVLKMPPKISAKCILNSIENYAWSNHHSVKNIIIAIYDPRSVTFQLYKEVLNGEMNKPGSIWKNSEGLKITIIGSGQESFNNACKSLSALSLL